jgi:hypothetical protein
LHLGADLARGAFQHQWQLAGLFTQARKHGQ